MSLGEKLSSLRREQNYTQEQLADLLGVSRQAISKWESDVTYPETDKLIRLSELYDCSLDYLLKEGGERMSAPQEAFIIRRTFSEKRSERTIMGMPLWHIGKNARGFIAIGLNARGFIAIGLMARGVIACGALSIGVISLGMLAIGLAAIGMFAIGAAAAGCIALGVLSAGAISVGVVSVGAHSTGLFSVGALSTGKYIAIGDNARAMIAVGDTHAAGSLFQKTGELTAAERTQVISLLDTAAPAWLDWAKEIVKQLLV